MVSRAAIFMQIAWRSLVACIVGGAALGALMGVGFVVFDALTDAADPTDVAGIAVITYIGAVFGVLLGIVAGVVLGLVGAFALVPYPGAARTRRVIRVVGMVLVALFSLLFVLDPGELNAGAFVFLGVLVIGGQVGAYLLGGWIVGWYIQRAETAAATPAIPESVAPPTGPEEGRQP